MVTVPEKVIGALKETEPFGFRNQVMPFEDDDVFVHGNDTGSAL